MAKSTTQPSEKQLLDFANQVKSLYEISVANRKRILFFNFLKGMATGAGAFLGGTLMIALLLWILTQFSQVPFAQRLSQSVKDSVQRQSVK